MAQPVKHIKKQDPAKVPHGIEILHDPEHNKGTAFTKQERDALGLRGLLPPGQLTQEQQGYRIMRNLAGAANDLERYIQLNDCCDRSEKLFYSIVMSNLEKLMPILYTPTVGQAAQEYGHIFRRPRGIYISARDRGRVKSLLQNWPHADVRVIVVTDGERILGLGDLGAHGMAIPVGKLQLYTACAGVPPEHCLPVMLDTGTNNRALLDDILYIGHRKRRLREEGYDELVEEFVTAIEELFPHCLIQFEDFANHNAFRLLRRYRDRSCVFNDDIQGTGAVALAGLLASMRVKGESITDQTFLFLGAGEASMGIALMVVTAMRREGMSKEEAKKHIWFFDTHGLVVKGREHVNELKERYVQEHKRIDDFAEAVRSLKPSVILGASGQPGTFSREIVENMAEINERPVIFALSNPTSKAECTAQEAIEWSEGRAIFASGSPFGPVKHKGRTYIPGQGNNAYIFPGVGLGIMASHAKHVTNEMFFEAARTLADLVDEDDLSHVRVYPPIDRIGRVSLDIAVAVAEMAWDSGIARVERPADVRGYIADLRYDPTYQEYA